MDDFERKIRDSLKPQQNRFFRVVYMQNGGCPFFTMYVRKSEKQSSGTSGWCNSIDRAVYKCFEKMTNPFVISKAQLAAFFTTKFKQNKTQACYFWNSWEA